ncbi:DUF2599 domain-containing protein [Luteibacter yeojuensis]
MHGSTWKVASGLAIALALVSLAGCQAPDRGPAGTAHAMPSPAAPDCPSPYIAGGAWKLDEYGPVLEITPTDCGRKVVGAEIDSLILEAIRKFGGNPRLTANLFGAMNQLECHAKLFPDKPTWNLEPDRPYVGLANTEAAECNPSVAVPDLPYY